MPGGPRPEAATGGGREREDAPGDRGVFLLAVGPGRGYVEQPSPERAPRSGGGNAMTTTRLMDLVLLVAELSRDARSFEELDRELAPRGYTAEEIEQALFWYSTRGDEVAMTDRTRHPVRVFNSFEMLSIPAESRGYLLRLLNVGVVDLETFERIVARTIPVGPEKIALADVKELACQMIFDPEVEDGDEDLSRLADDTSLA